MKNIIRIKEFSDYAITSSGNVYTYKRNKIMKSQLNQGGYEFVFLRKNNKNNLRFIHKLVYEAFIGEVPDGYTVDHKDGNKRNNKVENLQLLTRYENWEKFYNINVEKEIEGFKQIEGFNNYYINSTGDILSFKYNKSDTSEGLLLKSDGATIKLNKNSKTYYISKYALLNKYFNAGYKLIDSKEYKNI